jgi:PEGA domain
MMRVVTVALALGLGSLGCASAQHGARYDCELRVVAEPPGAAVLVNERFIGAARVLDKHPAKLTAGKKRLTVEAPGYFPHDMFVELNPGLTTVKAALRPLPQ